MGPGTPDRTIFSRAASVVGTVTAAVDRNVVAGSLADHWHTALMVEEPAPSSGGVRERVNSPLRACSATLAVVVTAFVDCRSMGSRQGEVHHLALVRGE